MDLKRLGLWMGPLLFVLTVCFVRPEGLESDGVWVLGAVMWIATWWVTEAIPIPAASLLPIVLFPIAGESISIKDIASVYMQPVMFLFVGGFMVALAMQKWGLHRRIALSIVAWLGSNLKGVVGGFILAAGLLSMGISNTATTLMMVPIALAVVEQISQVAGKEVEEKLGKALIISLAYSTSIGGIATLIGTPTNLIFAGFVRKEYAFEVPFLEWMLYGVPISLILLFVTWWYMVHVAFPMPRLETGATRADIRQQLKAMGPMSFEEKWVMWVFGIVALLWMTRRYWLNDLVPGVHDSMVVIVGAIVLFMVPTKDKTDRILDWKTAEQLPWGILLLFGGAFGVAEAFQLSGLDQWMADQLGGLQGLPSWLVLLIVTGMVTFLTEITQNMATATLMMPVLAALAPVLDIHPFVLMSAAAVAASCAFMLPFATAPNAIVFGTGKFTIRDMARVGFALNLVAIAVVAVLSYFVLPVVLRV